MRRLAGLLVVAVALVAALLRVAGTASDAAGLVDRTDAADTRSMDGHAGLDVVRSVDADGRERGSGTGARAAVPVSSPRDWPDGFVGIRGRVERVDSDAADASLTATSVTVDVRESTGNGSSWFSLQAPVVDGRFEVVWRPNGAGEWCPPGESHGVSDDLTALSWRVASGRDGEQRLHPIDGAAWPFPFGPEEHVVGLVAAVLELDVRSAVTCMPLPNVSVARTFAPCDEAIGRRDAGPLRTADLPQSVRSPVRVDIGPEVAPETGFLYVGAPGFETRAIEIDENSVGRRRVDLSPASTVDVRFQGFVAQTVELYVTSCEPEAHDLVACRVPTGGWRVEGLGPGTYVFAADGGDEGESLSVVTLAVGETRTVTLPAPVLEVREAPLDAELIVPTGTAIPEDLWFTAEIARGHGDGSSTRQVDRDELEPIERTAETTRYRVPLGPMEAGWVRVVLEDPPAVGVIAHGAEGPSTVELRAVEPDHRADDARLGTRERVLSDEREERGSRD